MMLFGAGIVRCADFSSGQCTDKALCDDALEAGADQTVDQKVGDGAPVDVNIDTVVGPDGAVPDGECNAGVEDCANGKDDNCNGLVDCDDPVCQTAGYVCTAAVPSGWTGPVALASVAGMTFPACSGAYATAAQQGRDGFSAAAAQCGCTCGGPTNVSCNTGIDLNYYTDTNCNTLYGGAGLPSLGFCVSTGDPSVLGAKGNSQATAYNGDCTSTPTKNVPAVTWTNSYSACNYDAPTDLGGCTGGSQCVQSPSTGKPCVYQVGDVACPSTSYTQKHTIYTSDSDDRSCATCTCTASAGTCTGSISIYSMPSCVGSPLASITTNGTCTSTPSARSAVATAINTNPGTCGNNGTGGATGDAGATGPVTVCCAP